MIKALKNLKYKEILRDLGLLQLRGLRAVSTNMGTPKLQLTLERAMPWQILILLKSIPIKAYIVCLALEH